MSSSARVRELDNLFSADPALTAALEVHGGEWGHDRAHALGAVAASELAHFHARRAERNIPRLVTLDRRGERVDTVEYDLSWEWLLETAVSHEIHSLPWTTDEPSGGHVVRAALEYLWTQVNPGVMCPVSMTYAAIPSLRLDAQIAELWEPRLTSSKPGGALCGMAMTEKQGGSDVRANITTATEVGDGVYEINGHKWFCSHPISDIFLVLAQAPAGLTCFVVERGPGFQLVRLKDKLGSRSLASAEVEFRGLLGRRLGPEGHGIQTIIEMVTHTRLDCVVGSAALMRRCVTEAVTYARQREAFGALLIKQPAMQAVLVDLVIESEAALQVGMRLARAYDEEDLALRRFATAVLKYWICKRTTAVAAEAMECLGGNGYVEEWPLAQFFRDAPLNGIWEGSSNVIALDVLRAARKDPSGLEAFLAECEQSRGANSVFDAQLDRTASYCHDTTNHDPLHARFLAEQLALAFQAALLIRHSTPDVADLFCASRLGDGRAYTFGAYRGGVESPASIIDRSVPG